MKQIATINIDHDRFETGIVQFSERKFPALVIQGDTMNTLYRECENLLEVLSDKKCDASAKELCKDLLEKLGEYKEHYETALKANELDIPYSCPSEQFNLKGVR